MKSKINAGNVIAFIIIFILAAGLIFSGVYFTVFGVSVSMQGEPMQLCGMALYPNLDESGQPHSYSAMMYDANSVIEHGSAVAYISEKSTALCKLSTAYFYGLDDEDGYILYNENEEEYFEVSKSSLRGRAMAQIPYIGALLSFSYSAAGTIFFGIFSLVIFLLWVVYFIGFIKRCKNKEPEEDKIYDLSIPAKIEDTSFSDVLKADKLRTTEKSIYEQDGVDKNSLEEQIKEVEEEQRGIIEDKLSAEFKAKGDEAYIYITGSVVKIAKLEKAIATLKEKKKIDIEVWPYDADPAGSEIRCKKDVLPIIVALIERINTVD